MTAVPASLGIYLLLIMEHTLYCLNDVPTAHGGSPGVLLVCGVTLSVTGARPNRCCCFGFKAPVLYYCR